MNIAWLVGTDFSKSKIADFGSCLKNSGAWVYTQLFRLQQDSRINKIVVISVNEIYKTDSSFQQGKMVCYLIKGKRISCFVNKSIFKKIDLILKKESIELLDIQGTETTISSYPLFMNSKAYTINTIHGIAYQCYNFYLLGIPFKSIIFGKTIHDVIFFRGMYSGKRFMKRRAKLEIELLKKIQYVRGRTNWDKASVQAINPQLKYWPVELILRAPFYENEWDINKSEPFRVFTIQSKLPYKGLLILIKAIEIVKQRYPSIRVYVPGTKFSKGLKRTGFGKLVNKEMKKRKLLDTFVFVGNLSADEMVDQLLKARLFVIPSMIENSPNSLAEAQMMGVPCVGSSAGGIPEYIKDGDSGLVFNPTDYVMCANCIQRLIEEDETCKKLSKSARTQALNRHNPNQITDGLLRIYDEIIDYKK